MQHSGPSIDRIVRIAEALGEELRPRVVFIGGAIAPLLQKDPPFTGPRPTKDVDAIVVTVSYSDSEAFFEGLRRRGFRQGEVGAHAHSWLAPGEERLKFDVVPAGNHFGASGNVWDEVVISTAVDLEIRPGLWIRHASAPGFIALKLGAFRDRGAQDPFGSHDLEDIMALLASRPEVATEVRETEESLRDYVAEGVRAIFVREEIHDLISAHLANVLPRDRRAAVFAHVYALLEMIASGAAPREA
jgi:predicted nucleotidyltransferase